MFERDMGDEYQHQAIYEKTCECGNTMTMTFECWDYPMGIINHTDIYTDGIKDIKGGCVPNLYENEMLEHDDYY